MKKLLPLLALFAGACQPPAPPAVAHRPAAVPSVATPAQPPAAADSLAPEAAALLRHYDLAPLWANQTETKQAAHAMEGFYGPACYRISFYFSQVTRDAQQPNVFHVNGVDRYKKVVTPFVGTITVQAVQAFTESMFADVADSTTRAFTAVGRFQLTEDPATRGAGNYSGKALLDFTIDLQGHLGQAMALMVDGGYENPTKGCGLLFNGTQVSNKTGQRHAVAFANYYGAVVPQALAGLHLGDRSEEINPNLVKLGWNEAWENDEWWADSPKPRLSL